MSEDGERFAGFIAGAPAITLPAQLFTELLPQIEDPVELRVTLHALFAIQRRRGRMRGVRASELASDGALMRGLEAAGGLEALWRGLEAAQVRGVLLACELEDGDTLYFANSEGGRRSLAALESGALQVTSSRPTRPVFASELLRTPARVYEQEIGALTPSVAEALTEACERYPEAWVIEALRIAAQRNARSWRYADAVLRRWQAEGHSSSETSRGETADGGDDGRAQGAARGATPADRAGPRAAPDPYARVVRRDWP